MKGPERGDSPFPSVPSLLLPGAEDTIVALATPPGRGALAVVRVSGPAAHDIAARVLTPWRPAPRTAYLSTVRDPSTGTILDRPVVTVYAAPRSYTGEDLVELSLHGGQLVPALVLGALLNVGAREALPGEFTRRAVANGKMDILQAEAVADLIDAQSRAMHGAALEQLDGGLSRRIAGLREALLHLEALLAYEIDFPEEDDGPVAPARIAEATRELLDALDGLLSTAATGELIRHGALVVIAGPTNAGKSSLFNALLGRARAIVTPIPGTTRDAIEAVLDVGPWPVRLVDTAGLRDTADVVERLGIEVSERYLRDADVVLACGDDGASLALSTTQARALTTAPVLAVLTKCDLVSNEKYSSIQSASFHSLELVSEGYETPAGSIDAAALPIPVVPVSAVTGAGLADLAAALAALLTRIHGGRSEDAPLLTRERHRLAVQRARDEVDQFAREWSAGVLPSTVVAIHLRAAIDALESLIGVIDVEEVLDHVFAAFCIGK